MKLLILKRCTKLNKIKIINSNFIDNDYLSSKLFTDLNKICVNNQKQFVKENDKLFQYSIIDFNNPLVKECKKDLQNNNILEPINNIEEYLNILGQEKISENELINCETTKLMFYIDFIKLYLLSKMPETIFLDDDVFISNKNHFIKSILKAKFDNKPCINGVCNMYNNNNFDFFKYVYELRKKEKFIIKDSEFSKKIKQEKRILKGICHIPFNESLLKKAFIINNSNKDKLLLNNNEMLERCLFISKVPLNENELSHKYNYIDYYSFDEFGKATFELIKKRYNIDEVIL